MKKKKVKVKKRPNRIFLDAKGKYYIKINGVKKYIKVAHPNAKLKNKNVNKLEQKQIVKVVINNADLYRKIKQKRKKRKEGVDRLHTNGVLFGRNILNKGNMTALPVGFNFDQAQIQNLSNKISGFETSLDLFKKNVRFPEVFEREKKTKTISTKQKSIIDNFKKPFLQQLAKKLNIPYKSNTTVDELRALLEKYYKSNPQTAVPTQSFTVDEPKSPEKVVAEDPEQIEDVKFQAPLFKTNNVENASNPDQLYTTPKSPLLNQRAISPSTEDIEKGRAKLKSSSTKPSATKQTPTSTTFFNQTMADRANKLRSDTKDFDNNDFDDTPEKIDYESLGITKLKEIGSQRRIPRSSTFNKSTKGDLIILLKQYDANQNVSNVKRNLNKDYDSAVKGVRDTNQAIINSFKPDDRETATLDEIVKDMGAEDEEVSDDQGGSGMGANEGLYNDELAKILKDRSKKFVPVISADEIPSLEKYIKRPRGRFCFISNTSKSHEAGRHWVAVCIDFDNAEIDYYDSFAELPNKTFLNDLHELIGRYEPEVYFKLKCNKVKDQSLRSKNCGWFASYFVIQMLKGASFAKASGFKNNVAKSEAQMNSFRKSFL